LRFHPLAAILAGWFLTVVPAAAQTPPSPAEIAAYTGLHKAEQNGDATEIARLIAAKADPNGRDGAGPHTTACGDFCPPA